MDRMDVKLSFEVLCIVLIVFGIPGWMLYYANHRYYTKTDTRDVVVEDLRRDDTNYYMEFDGQEHVVAMTADDFISIIIGDTVRVGEKSKYRKTDDVKVDTDYIYVSTISHNLKKDSFSLKDIINSLKGE